MPGVADGPAEILSVAWQLSEQAVVGTGVIETPDGTPESVVTLAVPALLPEFSVKMALLVPEPPKLTETAGELMVRV